MTAAVEFNNYSFFYGGKTRALEGISLLIPQGCFTAVTGPSGAGKTTLCMTISGLVPHYFGGAVSGSVTVGGMNTLNLRVSELAEKVGTVLEDYESQLVAMSVEDEIAFSLENRNTPRKEIIRRTGEVLALVGLKGKERLEISALSGGQKQRLAIASVLATKPEILVLDEPASALDPEGAEELYALLAELNSKHGITVVVVEHDLSKILPYIDQLVLMNEGKLEKAGKTADVLTYMKQHKRYTEALPALWDLKLSLEESADIRFGDWLNEEDAIEEIGRYLTDRADNEGVSKSA